MPGAAGLQTLAHNTDSPDEDNNKTWLEDKLLEKGYFAITQQPSHQREDIIANLLYTLKIKTNLVSKPFSRCYTRLCVFNINLHGLKSSFFTFFNRPAVAGAVLQTHL